MTRSADDLVQSDPTDDPTADTTAARRLRGRTAAVPALDRVAGLAARLLTTSSSQVSLLTDVQTVAAGAGLPPGAVGGDSPLADSLCTVTARSGGAAGGRGRLRRRAGRRPAPGHVRPRRSYLGVPLRRRRRADRRRAVRLRPGAAAAGQQRRDAAAAAGRVRRRRARAVGADQRARDRPAAVGAGHRRGRHRHLRLGRHLRPPVLGRPAARAVRLRRATTSAGTIEAFNARLHPDDLPRVAAALEQAVATGGTLRGGVPRAAARRPHPLGRRARTGAARRRRHDRPRARRGAGHDRRQRAGDPRRPGARVDVGGFYSLDREWRFTYVNAEAERLLGRPREELLGGVLWELFPATVGSEFERSTGARSSTGRPVVFEAYYPAPLDGWYELRAWPSPDGLGVYFLDITARRAAQDARRRPRRPRRGADAPLTETLDAAGGRRAPRALVVPGARPTGASSPSSTPTSTRTGGGGCATSAGGTPTRRCSPLLERYASARIAALERPALLAEALRTGRSARSCRGAAERDRASLAAGRRARPARRARARRSGAVQPLRARGRTRRRC